MLLFTCIAIAMLFIALLFVVAPLVKRVDVKKDVSADLSNLEILRSQQKDLDAELAQGAITQDEHQAAKLELAARVVDDVSAPSALPHFTLNQTVRLPWVIAIVAGFCASAIALYAWIGNPDAIKLEAQSGALPMANGATRSGSNAEDPQILAMVEKLAQKMRERPDDPKGWVLLARSQAALGRFDDAMTAFERAQTLIPDDASLLADYADAATAAQKGQFEGKPQSLIARALKLDPNQPKALALAATAELRRGQIQESLKYWHRLQNLMTKDSQEYRELETIIAEVSASSVSALPSQSAVSGNASNQAAKSSQTSATTSAKTTATAVKPAIGANVSVTGKVFLASSLREKLSPTDVLFIYARAKNGPRMPLAIQRLKAPTVTEYPLAFELNETMGIGQGPTLSSADEVVIEARVSKSGHAQRQSGDLSGVSKPVKPGSREIVITIDQIVP